MQGSVRGLHQARAAAPWNWSVKCWPRKWVRLAIIGTAVAMVLFHLLLSHGLLGQAGAKQGMSPVKVAPGTSGPATTLELNSSSSSGSSGSSGSSSSSSRAGGAVMSGNTPMHTAVGSPAVSAPIMRSAGAHKNSTTVSETHASDPHTPLVLDFPLWWWAPFFDKTSFGKEALLLVLGALRSGTFDKSSLWVQTKVGHCQEGEEKTMPRDDVEDVQAAAAMANASRGAIVVCHMLPPFWSRPKNKWKSCAPCPPVGYQAAVAVGRAMSETDLYHPEFTRIASRMDELWVPTQFHVHALNQSGIPVSKIRVVPLAVNTTYFDPDKWAPAKLPMGELVFGRARRAPTTTSSIITNASRRLLTLGDSSSNRALTHVGTGKSEVTLSSNSDRLNAPAHVGAVTQKLVSKLRPRSIGSKLRPRSMGSRHNRMLRNDASRDGANDVGGGTLGPSTDGTPYVFVSCFKWEMRKGWDVLLEAYLSEFSAEDNVELYILTKPFLDSDFKGDMHSWVKGNLGNVSTQRLPTLYVIPTHITNEEYVELLRASDAYVMPTRGEGWGMPISEASSMALPVIVTNWSGPTAFVDESIGYLLDYNLSAVPADSPWWFQGLKWANADVLHLRRVLRHVYLHPEEALIKGLRGRAKMVDQYSPAAVAQIIASEALRLNKMLALGKGCDSCFQKQWVADPGDLSDDLYKGSEPFLLVGQGGKVRKNVQKNGKIQKMANGGSHMSKRIFKLGGFKRGAVHRTIRKLGRRRSFL